MKTLMEAVAEAQARGAAIGHFNVANVDMLNAIVAAAQEAGEPVIIGASEGERDAIGIHTLVSLISEINTTSSVPIYLNADHTYSVERVKEAIDAGFDSVIFDGAQLSFEENLTKTKECVDYARASGRKVIVEAELGFIGAGSQLLDAIPEGAAITEDMMTSIPDAVKFVTETGIDMFAPAVGNIHGMLKNAANPRLSVTRVKEIADATGVPLVLHGGSGTTDEDFVNAIKAGIGIVHVSTELRRAYRQGLMQGLTDNPDEMAPYKYMKQANQAVKATTLARIKLFAGKA